MHEIETMLSFHNGGAWLASFNVPRLNQGSEIYEYLIYNLCLCGLSEGHSQFQ